MKISTHYVPTSLTENQARAWKKYKFGQPEGSVATTTATGEIVVIYDDNPDDIYVCAREKDFLDWLEDAGID